MSNLWFLFSNQFRGLRRSVHQECLCVGGSVVLLLLLLLLSIHKVLHVSHPRPHHTCNQYQKKNVSNPIMNMNKNVCMYVKLEMEKAEREYQRRCQGSRPRESLSRGSTLLPLFLLFYSIYVPLRAFDLLCLLQLYFANCVFVLV